MIGLNVRIVMPEESVVVPVTPRVAVNFERQFKIGLAKAFATEQRLEHMYYLGWEAMKAAGHVVKPFEGFLDSITRVEFAEDDASPLAG